MLNVYRISNHCLYYTAVNMDCQEPFRKKRNFRIFYGRATLFASESLQDIRPPENTSNRRRIKQLRSRRKLHRSDFPPLPPPESGEHCRQFSAAVTESPRGTAPAHRVVSKIWRMRCSVWRGDSTAIRELKRSITRNCATVESIAPSRRRCSSAVVGRTQTALSASGECR